MWRLFFISAKNRPLTSPLPGCNKPAPLPARHLGRRHEHVFGTINSRKAATGRRPRSFRILNSGFDAASVRKALLCTTPVLACLYSAPALAQQAISTPILASVQNFRDLAGISASNGGTGFADTTSNNGVMRTGGFYRSNVLNLSPADQATISALHIGLDIDLRTPTERTATPDKPIGAIHIIDNIYGTQNVPNTPPVTSPATAVVYMLSGYQDFVTNSTQRSGFYTALIDLANATGAALYHCSGGKDRTGWTSVILQSIAGVSPTTIMNDYLATSQSTSTLPTTAITS
jgi:hypothetical protein